MCKFGRDRAICMGEEAILVPAQKCPYHVTFDLDLDLEHILDALCASLVAIRPLAWEKKRFAQKFTDGRTDRHSDDGRRAIALAHSWNELKTGNVGSYRTDMSTLMDQPDTINCEHTVDLR